MKGKVSELRVVERGVKIDMNLEKRRLKWIWSYGGIRWKETELERTGGSPWVYFYEFHVLGSFAPLYWGEVSSLTFLT